MTPSFPFSVSLLALQNDEAVLVLCYAVLEGNCLSSMLAMAWKEMERRVFGFGDLVKTPTSAFGPHCVQATSHQGEADLGDQGSKLQARNTGTPQAPLLGGSQSPVPP